MKILHSIARGTLIVRNMDAELCFVRSYRTREEIDSMRKLRDPINRYRTTLLEKGIAPEDEMNVCWHLYSNNFYF